MTAVYAPHGSPALNRRIDAALGRIAADVRAALGSDLIALVLGGGYGRGEGAKVLRGGEEHPYNDLDLFVVVRRRWAWGLRRLGEISRAHRARLSIDVDFGRPLTLADLRHLPSCLMWQDLVNGHVVIDGPSDVLTANAPPELREPLQGIEATRLLLNRGAGLLWAMRVAGGLEPAPDEDFVRRNREKCRLALGDAVLIAHRRFQTRYQGRDHLLAALEDEEPPVADLALLPAYREALAFKLDPGPPPADGASPAALDELRALGERWAQVLLHVEGRRTGRRWADALAWAAWDGVREAAQHGLGSSVRNALLNGTLGRIGLRHPREALYRELPSLLCPPQALGATWGVRSAAFLDVWRRFN